MALSTEVLQRATWSRYSDCLLLKNNIKSLLVENGFSLEADPTRLSYFTNISIFIFEI